MFTATKVKLFNTTCVTILLYGCELWVISQDMENKINAFATSCYRVMLNIKRIDHVLNTTVYSMTDTVPLIHLVRHRQLKFLVTSSRCQRKSLLEDMLCTFLPLAKGDLVDPVLHTLIMYKDCLGIMKEQCKNSRLPHLLMIVMHGEILWSPAPQLMDDDDDEGLVCFAHEQGLLSWPAPLDPGVWMGTNLRWEGYRLIVWRTGDPLTATLYIERSKQNSLSQKSRSRKLTSPMD